MARFATKRDLINEMLAERRLLEMTLADIESDAMTEQGVCEGCSIKEVLARLMEWEQAFLSWYRAGMQGTAPSPPRFDLAHEADMNQRIYRIYQDVPLQQIMIEFRASFGEVFDVVNNLSEADLVDGGRFDWTDDQPLASFVEMVTAVHYRWATQEILQWLQRRSS